jgi:hypothetical protein
MVQMIKVDLNGTSMYVIGNIINNNIGNGLDSLGKIYNEYNQVILSFTNTYQFYDWWRTTYGENGVGLDYKYVLINFP